MKFEKVCVLGGVLGQEHNKLFVFIMNAEFEKRIKVQTVSYFSLSAFRMSAALSECNWLSDFRKNNLTLYFMSHIAMQFLIH